MRLLEYMSLISTYMPTELGLVEHNILGYFVYNEHISTYDIYKDLKNEVGKPNSYKNIHKRVKRLQQLNLIQPLSENFERGAKHYKITPYGLTMFLSNFISEDARYIQLNKDNIVIKSLLLEYFEEETINSFYSLKDDNTGEIAYYLSDCCGLINNTCSKIWNKIEEYDIGDILPEDKIIQSYMIYLDGRSIEHSILDEIERYKLRLSNRVLKIKDEKMDSKKIADDPQFPLNYIYYELYNLDYLLYKKIRSLVISLVNMIGICIEGYAPNYEKKIEEYLREHKSIDNQHNRYKKEISNNINIIELIKKRMKNDENMDRYEKNKMFRLIRKMEEENSLYNKNIDPRLDGKRPIDLILDNFGRDYSMAQMMKDKKLLVLINDIKREFDLGYEQFMKYN